MSIILFFLVLFLLVIVHEFGHFIIAKWAGIRVDEFAFGFPPRIGSIKRGETRYSFNALPLGGYVKIYGENANEVSDDADKKRSFTAQNRFVQASVIVAGVVFNLALAWVLISVTLMMGISARDNEKGAPIENARLMITAVREGAPAEVAGLKSGDILLSIGNEITSVDVLNPDTVSEFISPRKDEQITFTILREEEKMSIAVTPVEGIVEDRAAVGISMDMVGILQLPPHLAFIEGAKRTYYFTTVTAVGLWDFLSNAIVGKSDFSQVTGPVGIVNAVGEAADVGFVNLLLFTAIISINLAIINIIPFPALDGGRLLFIIIETVIRRPIGVTVTNLLNVVGFALLMLLMVLVTWSDVSKLLN